MIRTREVDRFLQTKLHLTRIHGSNHDHYTFEVALGIGLPTVLALSRHSGDIPNRNIKGLADGLGLKLDELHDSMRCSVSANVVYLCLALHLLRFVSERMSFDPVVHGEGCRAMAKSVMKLLAMVDVRIAPNATEERILDRLIVEIERVNVRALVPAVQSLSIVISKLIGRS